MDKIIEFKTDRIKSEWMSANLDKRLGFIVYALAGMIWVNFGKKLTLTDIYRTREENQSIYGNPNAHDSVHQFWRGVDFSVKDFLETEVEIIREFINGTIYYGHGKMTLLIHNVGAGMHGHLQVNSNGMTEIHS